jgi:hypothetical protein
VNQTDRIPSLSTRRHVGRRENMWSAYFVQFFQRLFSEPPNLLKRDHELLSYFAYIYYSNCTPTIINPFKD